VEILGCRHPMILHQASRGVRSGNVSPMAPLRKVAVRLPGKGDPSREATGMELDDRLQSRTRATGAMSAANWPVDT
jgi:hypothetical protein